MIDYMPLISSLNWILEKWQPGSFSHQQERILEKISLNLKQQQQTTTKNTWLPNQWVQKNGYNIEQRPNQNVSMYSSEKQEFKKDHI